MNDFAPLGKKIEAPAAKRCPSRREVRPGIFEVDGKLQTDLPINGPQYAPGRDPYQHMVDTIRKQQEAFEKQAADGYPLEFWATW